MSSRTFEYIKLIKLLKLKDNINFAVLLLLSYKSYMCQKNMNCPCCNNYKIFQKHVINNIPNNIKNIEFDISNDKIIIKNIPNSVKNIRQHFKRGLFDKYDILNSSYKLLILNIPTSVKHVVLPYRFTKKVKILSYNFKSYSSHHITEYLKKIRNNIIYFNFEISSPHLYEYLEPLLKSSIRNNIHKISNYLQLISINEAGSNKIYYMLNR